MTCRASSSKSLQRLGALSQQFRSVACSGTEGVAVGYISELALYPVKSCGAVLVSAATAEATGLVVRLGSGEVVRDRMFMVVDQTNSAVTQRMAPGLATVSTHLTATGLLLTAPGAPQPLAVALNAQDRAPRECTLYAQKVNCLDCGDEAAAWFSEILTRDGRVTNASTAPPYRLVRLGEGEQRLCSASFLAPLAEGKVEKHDAASFSDFSPLLITATASLDDLNNRVTAVGDGAGAVAMNRFRPNLVIRTSQPWEEDSWSGLVCGEGSVGIHCMMRCPRCVIPTVDQATGVAGYAEALEAAGDGRFMQSRFAEPLRTLKKFRSLSNRLGVIGRLP
eukprot:CAMPEP_0180519008 /NCGR_PEP_ID=MMETSP1036_2-20121128/55431_1 /TAXON_ID=632150 /ORGANISM="Azadinium spinosum, Strain 3D9" /LENGTH=335 /DNA_ID=CAMNT_0022531263 /DNA_START=7 /DNA_END=1011 /DNA_ORIENTATION=-